MLHEHLIARTSPLANASNIYLYKNFRITVLKDRLFRIEQSESGRFCDEATQTVWFRDMPPVKFSVNAKEKYPIIYTDGATLILADKIEDFRVTINGSELTLSNDGNLLGTYRTLDCCNGNILHSFQKNTDQPIKLGFGIASKSGVAVYDDSDSLILHEDGTLGERESETDLYVFAYGKDFRGALCALYDICGKVPMFPRFALGNWWSRYHAYTEHEYLQTMDRLLNKRRIPLAIATVDMDWHRSTTVDEHFHITESGKNDDFHGHPESGWTGYTWNTDLFPDYRRFLLQLHKRGLHVTLNLHPARGVRFFEKQYEDMARATGIDPSTEQVVAFDFTSDKFINAYFDILHKPYEHEGVDFWWIDWQQGTKTALAGLDPLWALNHYHTLDSGNEHAPIILSRYAGIGSHRYPIGFSGDTFVTWETLSYLPYFTANATNAGFTWWSHDIGGHMAGMKNDELHVRFVQFGVFSPINRLHCTDSALSTKESSVYMNGTGLIADEFLRLRHRLIPYLWSAAYETSYYGRALIEPLYYEYPDCEEAYEYKNEYLFGREMLVAPITAPGDEKGMATMEVWLPEGHWTDFFTDDEYDGRQVVQIVRWMDTIPVFVREGAFVVLDAEVRCDTDEPDALEVRIYPGRGSYTLYEENAKTVFTSEQSDKEQIITIKSENAKDRTLNLIFPGIKNACIRIKRASSDIEAYEINSEDESPVILRKDEQIQITVKAETETYIEKRNRMLLYTMLRIQGDQKTRNWLYNEIIKLSDAELRQLVITADYLTENEKIRLLESLYITED